MFKTLQSFFNFNRQQRNGVVMLLGICFALVILKQLVPLALKHAGPKIEIIGMRPLVAVSSPVQKVIGKSITPFDPNTISADSLYAMGIPEKLVRSLVGYRRKIGPFRSAKQLRKLYGMNDSIYDLLNGKLKIAQSQVRVHQTNHQVPLIELNTADSAALVAVKGIGPFSARNILKYRELLGGYTNVDQLAEVHGISSEIFNIIKVQVTADPSLIRKLAINTADFRTVNRHPYIEYEECRKIFRTRDRSPIDSALLAQVVTDRVKFMKLLPYVDFHR